VGGCEQRPQLFSSPSKRQKPLQRTEGKQGTGWLKIVGTKGALRGGRPTVWEPLIYGWQHGKYNTKFCIMD
jgi:hypothetical protein